MRVGGTRRYSQDVNDYLRQIAGEDFTAKRFPHVGWSRYADKSRLVNRKTSNEETGKIEHNGDLRGRGTSWQQHCSVPKVLRSSGNRGGLPEPNAHRGSQW